MYFYDGRALGRRLNVQIEQFNRYNRVFTRQRFLTTFAEQNVKEGERGFQEKGMLKSR